MDYHNVWAVYCTDEALFLNSGVIAIEESALGDLSRLSADRDAFRARFAAAHPDAAGLTAVAVPNALFRLACELRAGDYVVCFADRGESVSIGTVTGDYFYDETVPQYRHRRAVKWLRRIAREELSRGALREISRCAAPVFPVEKYKAELLAFLGISVPVEPRRETMPVVVSAGPVADAGAFVTDSLRDSRNRGGFRRLVAGLLLAMGYQVTQLAYGDVDLIADRDELLSRILVRVLPEEVRADDIRTLRSALRGGEYGLLISALELPEALRSAVSDVPGLRAVAGGELAELVLRYYDRLDEQCRSMIPLRAVYIPA